MDQSDLGEVIIIPAVFVCCGIANMLFKCSVSVLPWVYSSLRMVPVSFMVLMSFYWEGFETYAKLQIIHSAQFQVKGIPCMDSTSFLLAVWLLFVWLLGPEPLHIATSDMFCDELMINSSGDH